MFIPSLALSSNEQQWQQLRRADPDEMIQVTLALKQVNTEWLDVMLATVSDPASPEYGHHMSLEEIVRHVHGDPTGVRKIRELFQQYDIEPRFTIGEGFAVIDLPVSIAEKVFAAQLYHYQHLTKTDLVTVRTPTYELPSIIQPYIDFACCIDQFPSANTVGVVRSYNTSRLGVSPSSIRSDYEINDYTASNSNTTQAIASFLKQYFSVSDLKKFQDKFDIPSNPIAKVIGKNKEILAGTEASLDVQYITGMLLEHYNYV